MVRNVDCVNYNLSSTSWYASSWYLLDYTDVIRSSRKGVTGANYPFGALDNFRVKE
jgi:hypothetical protein